MAATDTAPSKADEEAQKQPKRGRFALPDLGVGVGLRVPHYAHILEHRPEVDFFEIISENFMVEGGRPRYHLSRVLESYPVIQHGVSMNVGGPDKLDRDYLVRLRQLVREVKPAWLSDHFCWCGSNPTHLHDLLPLPYTAEAVRRVAERAKMVQDFLEVRFALENTSSYMTYTSSTMSEWDFVGEIAERADIGILFDVNNVYVSAYNHGFDPWEFVRGVPVDRIVQIHLAGHTNLGKYIIDTHRGHVIDPVWELYRETIRRAGSVPTLIEWDDEIPSFETLMAEAEHARRVRQEGLELRARGAAEPERHRAIVRRRAPEHTGVTWKQGGPREIANAD